jgi:hypothetical protein
MMAAIILVFSLVTLMMFFVSYCRSLMASSASHSLSEEVRDVTGIRTRASGQDFTRVLQLLQLCPERPADRTGLQAVQLYYSFLSTAQSAFSRILPSFRAWAENERASCAYFVAVVLDKRISFNREMLIQQSDS